MFFHGPGFEGGRTVDGLVSLVDIPATILDCAGIEPPGHFRGRALGKMIGDPHAAWEDCVFIQISESQVGRCVRTTKWKYAVRADANVWADSGAEIYYEDCLYDLENDPHERNNLVEDTACETVRGELAALLLRKMKQKIPLRKLDNTG